MEPELEVLSFANATLVVPKGYSPALNLRETEAAIKFVKDNFQLRLAQVLNLQRVSAPLMVLGETGINDHLNEVERPVSFEVSDMKKTAEVMQSLAKWKRLALADYGFEHGEGLYTDMNAIRRDERLTNLHSIYVDQWDWERVISEEERSIAFLKRIVRRIYSVIRDMEGVTCNRFPQLRKPFLPDDIFFIHAQELEDRHPGLAPQERENEICREKGAVFIMGIGADLESGKPHDGRAADYDDWWTIADGKRGLNGDILVWYPVLNCAVELSSMGIRVDQTSLEEQLKIRGQEYKKNLYYHRRLLKGELPLTIGGGIGQSRLCMLYLRKAHIGEVQASVWHDDLFKACKQNNIRLL